jgi:hypothetical protein
MSRILDSASLAVNKRAAAQKTRCVLQQMCLPQTAMVRTVVAV